MAILTELQEQEATIYEYDVFLSFRGKDTRLTFIDHLYRALINENIRTFLDEEEVENGQELKPELTRAIKSSRASIVVLSQNYASSSWCLDELVLILDQWKTCNHFVLPIFYHIEPAHVRKQQSSYEDAMNTHKKIFDAENDQEIISQHARKLELWTKGLAQVADLKGKDANGRRETVFIDEIVKEISSRLNLELQSKLPQLIGTETSVDTISSWIKRESSTVDILTILGMAGIGKTYLADYIYILHKDEFERCSFIEGIERKCAQHPSALFDLEKQLVGDILKQSMTGVHDVNYVRTTKIEKTFLNKKLLVVLDGIDKLDQLDVLIGTKGFHPGSKIIITTKDGSLTEKCVLFRKKFPPKHAKHALYGLNETSSLRLLCLHAFGGNDLKEGYEEEAKRVASYCGGHPLALKVLGSSLINEDVGTWCDVYEMLQTNEFYSDIHKVLRISFDSLPSENCKELFKHIACFFVGKDIGVTQTILDGCGIHTSYGIKKLIDRCLLTIGSYNELIMHQLVQDMGRDLVRQESLEKPWKRSRLWNPDECLNVLKEDKGTSKIQGLVLDMNMLEEEPLRVTKHKFHVFLDRIFGADSFIHGFFEFCSMICSVFVGFFLMFSSRQCTKVELRTEALVKMDRLNLLQLNHVKLKGSYQNFPKRLRWLCMHGFQLKYIPSNLPMENLVSLDMSYSDLKHLWHKPKVMGSLKILNLSYCKVVKVGGFSKLPSLERLVLKGCVDLIHVCESIGGCDKLTLIDLSYCNKLKNLPSSTGKLKNVQVLSVDGCIGVGEFPVEMKSLGSVIKELKRCSITSTLHAYYSPSFTKGVPRTPKSLSVLLLPSLTYLSLTDNNLSNASFPIEFSSLQMLEGLILDGNPIDSLPHCVGSLRNLEVLSVGRRFLLKSIECPPGRINLLSTGGCTSLEKITYHSEISRPPFVDYIDTQSLKEIEGIFKIQDIAQVAKKKLCCLGWKNLEFVKDQELQTEIPLTGFSPKMIPVQMFYEFGIFSTCFIGKEVPNWLPHRSNGSSTSFIMPPSPMNKSIHGINIGFRYSYLGMGRITCGCWVKLRNVTKNSTWIYLSGIFITGEVDEDIVWLSHWMFRNNELEDGDKVCVTVYEEDNLKVKECAICPMYNCKNSEAEDPLEYYKSWKYIIGGDLSGYQLTSGDYFLFTFRSIFLPLPHVFNQVVCNLRLQPNHMRRFWGYDAKYKTIPINDQISWWPGQNGVIPPNLLQYMGK